jgi:hypothetical protein
MTDVAIWTTDAGVTPDWGAVRRAIQDLTVERFDAASPDNPATRAEEMQLGIDAGDVDKAASELVRQECWLRDKKLSLIGSLEFVEEMLNVESADMQVRTLRDADAYMVWLDNDPSELWYAWEALTEAGVIYVAGFDEPEPES